jgi:hypothetical protein
MLIWIGVVLTILALVGMVICSQLGIATGCVSDFVQAFAKAADQIETACHDHMQACDNATRIFGKQMVDENNRAAAEMGKVLDRSIQTYSTRSELAVAEFKTVAAAFTKSEQELAENLGHLLREVKVSKQLSQGALAVIEQNVLAIDKLWQMVEMIRTGPRSAAKVQPTEADAAAHEQGLDDAEQQAAIESQLANAAQRMREIRENFQGV